jgi:hypothetical protein
LGAFPGSVCSFGGSAGYLLIAFCSGMSSVLLMCSHRLFV